MPQIVNQLLNQVLVEGLANKCVASSGMPTLSIHVADSLGTFACPVSCRWRSTDAAECDATQPHIPALCSPIQRLVHRHGQERCAPRASVCSVQNSLPKSSLAETTLLAAAGAEQQSKIGEQAQSFHKTFREEVGSSFSMMHGPEVRMLGSSTDCRVCWCAPAEEGHG
jgi:hypothetical protein